MAPFALLDDGRAVFVELETSTRSEQSLERGSELRVVSEAGTRVGAALRLDASTLWLRFTLPGGMHAAAEQPWSTRDLLTASPGGDGFAIVRGRGTDREVGRYEVLWFDTGAELVRSRSVTFRAAPLDDAVIDSFLDGVSSGFGERYGANVGPLRRAITDALYTPEYLPGVGTTRRGWSGGGVLLSEDGSTWVRQQDVGRQQVGRV